MSLDLGSYLLGKSKGGGGGGTSDYSQLSNKPSINGITLSGNKTSEELGISGETHYLGSSSDYSSSNRLEFANLAHGLYTLHYDSFLYCQATINGTTYQFTLSPSQSDTPSNGIAYLEITHPITDNYASNTYIGTFNYLTVSEYYSKIKTYQLSILYNGSGINASSGMANAINAVNTDKTQTISGKKTFTTLPESSVVPTTDDQLVNKKYVDDIVGNISTVLATLTTPGGEE